MKRTLFDRLERYREKIQHVKILTHRGHVLELSEFYELTYRHEVTLLGDITLFENISQNCLRILHLEVMLSQSVDEIRTEDLIEHPTLEVVSIVILQSCMSSVRSDLHCKFVKGRNSLDISVKNIGPSQWGKWVSKRKIDERCVLQYLTIFEFSHPIRYKNYVNRHGLFNFLTLCNCCPKMEKLVVNIRSILSETEFSNLLKLKNLSLLVVEMKYNFSRNELARIFENSNFSQLVVKIKEVESSRSQPQEITLKNGGVTVCFSSSAEDS